MTTTTTEPTLRPPPAARPIPVPARQRNLSVGVFCGARTGPPEAVALARELGELLGRCGHRLVYGGGGSGLMGTVAWAAYEHGAEILGVIPQFLAERERSIAAPPQELRITDTMCERKDLIVAEADVFIALPGGYGTVDEVLDVLSLSYLQVHEKPLVLLQPGQEWKAFLDLLDTLVGCGYADPIGSRMLQVTDDAADALRMLHASPARVA